MSEAAELFAGAPPAPVKDKYISKGAELSPCGRYRYLLWREWRGTHDPKNWTWYGFKDGAGADCGDPKTVLFVMLNPSTADGEKDDATIRRCVGFAKSWKYERVEVVNLYAFRATKPRDLWKAGDARHAPRNQSIIAGAARRAGIVIAAWGAHGAEGEQGEIVRGWMNDCDVYHLGLTKEGHPRHPLYLPSDATPKLLK
jgi:hypothetical protein